MAVGMLCVGRLRRETYGHQRREGGRDVDDAFERVGKKGDAAGDLVSDALDEQDNQADGDAAESQLAGKGHKIVSRSVGADCFALL